MKAKDMAERYCQTPSDKKMDRIHECAWCEELCIRRRYCSTTCAVLARRARRGGFGVVSLNSSHPVELWARQSKARCGGSRLRDECGFQKRTFRTL